MHTDEEQEHLQSLQHACSDRTTPHQRRSVAMNRLLTNGVRCTFPFNCSPIRAHNARVANSANSALLSKCCTRCELTRTHIMCTYAQPPQQSAVYWRQAREHSPESLNCNAQVQHVHETPCERGTVCARLRLRARKQMTAHASDSHCLNRDARTSRTKVCAFSTSQHLWPST